jgi:hypothetical protein
LLIRSYSCYEKNKCKQHDIFFKDAEEITGRNKGRNKANNFGLLEGVKLDGLGDKKVACFF